MGAALLPSGALELASAPRGTSELFDLLVSLADTFGTLPAASSAASVGGPCLASSSLSAGVGNLRNGLDAPGGGATPLESFYVGEDMASCGCQTDVAAPKVCADLGVQVAAPKVHDLVDGETQTAHADVKCVEASTQTDFDESPQIRQQLLERDEELRQLRSEQLGLKEMVNGLWAQLSAMERKL